MTSILQTQLEISQGDPSSLIIMVFALIGIFTAFTILSKKQSTKKTKQGARPKSGKAYSSKSSPRALSSYQLKKKAQSYGLSSVEAKSLNNIANEYKVPVTEQVFKDSQKLDSVLSKAMGYIEAASINTSTKESQKLTLFRIKQKIEYGKAAGFTADSHRLKNGLSLVVITNANIRYQSRLLGKTKDALAISIPKNSAGQFIELKQNEDIVIQFWMENGDGYFFKTKVFNISSINDISCILISHSKIKRIHNRQYERKPIDKPAYFYPVHIVSIGKGRKEKKKAVVDAEHRAYGTIHDISSGGLSLVANYPLEETMLIKIEFSLDKKDTLKAYGKIRSIDRLKPRGGIMHVQFTSISKQNLNKINNFVYKLLDDEK